MSVVDIDLGEEIVSESERAPSAAPTTSAPSVTCHYCPEVFEGGARWFARGRHEKAKHAEEWKAAKVAPAKKSAEKKPTPKKAPVKKATVVSSKRISAADSLSDNIGRAARMLGSVNPAMSRALVFSAPATGQAIDEVVAGTIVDKVIQPFAKAADKWDRLGGVLSFPILFAVVSAKPDLLPMLEDDLREATVDVLIASIPTLMKKKAREKKAVEALSRLGEVDPRYANTTDPIGLMLTDLLYGPQPKEGDGENI
ncbi:MAG: hypothetical protein ACYC56_13180 [Candidatus Aquicultor sp.]